MTEGRIEPGFIHEAPPGDRNRVVEPRQGLSIELRDQIRALRAAADARLRRVSYDLGGLDLTERGMEPGRITPEEFLFEFETRFRTGFHLLSKDMRSEIEGDLRKIRRLLQERRRADERGDNSDDINDQMRELEASVRVAELVIDQSLSERELVVRFFLRIRRMSSPTRSEVGWSISDI